jgi:hypothetical protein
MAISTARIEHLARHVANKPPGSFWLRGVVRDDTVIVSVRERPSP